MGNGFFTTGDEKPRKGSGAWALQQAINNAANSVGYNSYRMGKGINTFRDAVKMSAANAAQADATREIDRGSRPRNRQVDSGVPSSAELASYSDAQVNSEYRPTINDLTRQIEAANAMGAQSDATIGNWGREAGREIRGAGRRNYREVRGIQNNMGNMLGSLEAVVGPMYTNEGRRSAMQSAAGTAGLIAGLGAADQGWFNRARDVNAQTTNFYRNNARDQYAQQGADLLAQRNDQVAAMRGARTAGRVQAKQQAYENQIASADAGSDGSLGVAMQKFQESLGLGGGVKQLAETFKNQITSPQERAAFERWARANYFGTADTPQGKSRLRLVRLNQERAKQAE